MHIGNTGVRPVSRNNGLRVRIQALNAYQAKMIYYR